MSKLMDKLLHRSRAATTAGAGVCDICSTTLDSVPSHRVSAADFRRVVEQGYNPMATGRANTGLAGALGLGPEAAYPGWRQMAILSATDWALCEACANDVAAFRAFRARH